jgi:hypothetical protein
MSRPRWRTRNILNRRTQVNVPPPPDPIENGEDFPFGDRRGWPGTPGRRGAWWPSVELGSVGRT